MEYKINDIKNVKAGKMYVKSRDEYGYKWTTIFKKSTIRDRLPDNIRFFRLSPIAGEYGVRFFDVNYGCNWLITSDDGGVCGEYIRPIDYKPSLNCKNYPILSREEIFDCILNYVSRNPESITNVPNGFVQNTEDAKLFMSRFKEVARQKISTLTDDRDKKYWMEKISQDKLFLEKNLKKMIKHNNKVESITESTL